MKEQVELINPKPAVEETAQPAKVSTYINPTVKVKEAKVLANHKQAAISRKAAIDFIRTMGYIPNYSGKEGILYISKPDTNRSPDVSPASLLLETDRLFPMVTTKFTG